MKSLKDYGYANERDFALAAAQWSEVRIQYKTFLRTVAIEQVDKLIEAGRAHADKKVELIELAMLSFDRAFNHYVAGPMQTEDFHFSEYFAWWARQYASGNFESK